ncbi:unnamed protein product [Tilletia controversa]|uniref:Uncharacterized protein n=2 Tax=Tilletia TaxID=13289 RepID=A0A177UTS4_9BASI|nr:hypothetical protein A4X03_0g5932 [Tilletia caries]CAD6917045.1 unnamed protein product [Tilletia controversa]CAD6956079.1 unnamed protein product [Tilletia controversa]
MARHRDKDGKKIALGPEEVARKKKSSAAKAIRHAAAGTSAAGSPAASSSSSANRVKVKVEEPSIVSIKEEEYDQLMDEVDASPGEHEEMAHDDEDVLKGRIKVDSDDQDHLGQATNASSLSAPVPPVCWICDNQDCLLPQEARAIQHCRIHDPRSMMDEIWAVKHFAIYRSFHGDLTPVDLLHAESEGKLTVRYKEKGQVSLSGTKKFYFVKELCDLSRAKQDTTGDEIQVREARDMEALRIKQSKRREAKKAHEEAKNNPRELKKLQAEKKSHKQAQQQARKEAVAAILQADGHAPHPETSAALASPSSSRINEAGPSSSVTVTSTLIIDVPDDDGDDHNTGVVQALPSNVPAADPQPAARRLPIKIEPGAPPPMLPPTANAQVSTWTKVKVKQEAGQSRRCILR